MTDRTPRFATVAAFAATATHAFKAQAWLWWRDSSTAAASQQHW